MPKTLMHRYRIKENHGNALIGRESLKVKYYTSDMWYSIPLQDLYAILKVMESTGVVRSSRASDSLTVLALDEEDLANVEASFHGNN
jgi:hypothetical protein